MNNKFFLKTMLENIDKEFPKSALLYGVNSTEENPVHVFVLLDDNHMYFGKQVRDTGQLKIKKVDIDKISKVFFTENVLSVQIRDSLYEVVIFTQEVALRALCKEFKLIKSKEATRTGGDIMNCDFEETSLADTTFDNLRVEHAPFVSPQQIQMPELMEEPVLPLITLPEYFAKPQVEAAQLPEAKQGSMGEEQLEKGSALQPSDFLSTILMDIKKPEPNQVELGIPMPKQTVPLTEKVEIPSILPMEVKQLSKKEMKTLAKQQMKMEKAERAMYQKAHNGFVITLLVLLAVALLYLITSYVLATFGIVELPLHNLPDILVLYFNSISIPTL